MGAVNDIRHLARAIKLPSSTVGMNYEHTRVVLAFESCTLLNVPLVLEVIFRYSHLFSTNSL